MDADFIVVLFGGYGMLVVWGPYGWPQFLTLTSLEPDL
jgi:hypothetical protein